MIHLVDSEGHQHNKCANCDLSMKFGSYVPYTRAIKKSEGDNQSKDVHRPPGAKTPLHWVLTYFQKPYAQSQQNLPPFGQNSSQDFPYAEK